MSYGLRLLQVPMPKPKGELPGQVWLRDMTTTGRDAVEIGWSEFGRDTFSIPQEVMYAAREYWARQWPCIRPNWHEQIAVLLGLWLVYQREQEYVLFEPVSYAPSKYAA